MKRTLYYLLGVLAGSVIGSSFQQRSDQAAIVRYQSEGVAHMLENLKGTGFHLCKDGAR